MNAFTGVRAIVLVSAVAAISIGMSDQDSGPVWLLVVCASLLPTFASINALRKARRVRGREGAAWRLVAASMALMIPIYYAHFFDARVIENFLIAAAYGVGAVAIVVVPLPNAGLFQRIVASLDAVGIGVVAAVATLGALTGSGLDVGEHAVWVVVDAAIVAMVGYVAIRRSQRRGVDWSLFALIGGVGAYLAGVLASSASDVPYHIGHSADVAYFFGMAAFAFAPLMGERRRSVPQQILEPVRWGHVLTPYLLIVVLVGAYVGRELSLSERDVVGMFLELGLLVAMLLVLVRQLALIAEQRRKVDLERSGVISTISHELRTPLTSVVGFLDLLSDWESFDDEEKIEMVTLMRGQARVLSRVVGDLVDVSRNKIGDLTLRRSTFGVEALFDEATDHVQDLVDRQIHLDIEPAATMTADRERMIQVMSSFLSNAAQYGADRIAMVGFEGGGETVIEVHDDGPGVPDIYRVVIWERFERGAHRQSSIPGSGIGLAVVKGIAESHGGSVSYRRSERLGGACFSIRVPTGASGAPDVQTLLGALDRRSEASLPT